MLISVCVECILQSREKEGLNYHRFQLSEILFLHSHAHSLIVICPHFSSYICVFRDSTQKNPAAGRIYNTVVSSLQS